jgi:hypothetical protein
MIAIVLIALAPAGIIRWMSQGGGEFLPDETTAGPVLARTVSGDLAIAISSRSGAISTGRQTFFVEFRSVKADRLIDVGDVQLSATMAMPGMSMSGGVSVQRTSTPGRYEASGDFGMAGAWTMAVEWNGPAGRGSTVLQGDVR